MPKDPRSTRAWRKLRDRVVAEEPECRLRIPGVCTFTSETADHIQPVHSHPHLAMVRENHQGACHACNRRKLGKTFVPSQPGYGGERAARPRALDIFVPLEQLAERENALEALARVMQPPPP